MSASARTAQLGRWTIALFAMCVALTVVTGSAMAQTGVLQGTVTDADTGLPIEGAMVVARGMPGGAHPPGHNAHRTFTGADGTYLFEELPAGDYRVLCGAPGYFRADAEATIVDGQTTVLDFALEALAFGSVGGFVTDAVSGDPIAGARVVLLPPHGDGSGDGGHWLTAVTGPDGSYLIEHVLAGDYDARAWAFGYHVAQPVPVTVVEGETAVVNFALEPLTFGSLEGTVTDAVTGAAIAGAHVVVLPPIGDTIGNPGGGTGGGWHHVMTDDNGFYRFEQVIAGDHRVVVRADGYFPAEAEVEVFDGQTTVADFALEALVFGSIEGTVTDADTGAPIGGAWVMIHPAGMDAGNEGLDGPEGGGGGGWQFARTDDSGFYRFEEVPAGSYRVRAFARWYLPAMVEAEVLEGQTTVVNFELEPWTGPFGARE